MASLNTLDRLEAQNRLLRDLKALGYGEAHITRWYTAFAQYATCGGTVVDLQYFTLETAEGAPRKETMTTEFTATNGIEIEISEDGYLLGKGDYGSGPTYATGGPDGIAALREYFMAERDQELGRWRDPENTNMVVYRVPENDDKDGRAVRVIDEATGMYASLWERDVKHPERGSMYATAARYFAAHPEPKPWHDAKPGEVWVIKLQGDAEGQPVGVFDFDGVPHFFVPGAEDFSTRYRRIESGYRIWPEETDDE